MPLSTPDRAWMQEHEVFQDYKRLRDDLKLLDVPAHEAINDALYRVSHGERGSPYNPEYGTGTPEALESRDGAPERPQRPPEAPAPPNHLPAPPKRLEAKFGEVSEDSSYVAIQWVGQHMAVLDVKESDAPDSTAYALLIRCQESPSFRDDFWAKIWIKTIPSTKALESQQRFRDKGQPILELNAEIRRVLLLQRDAGGLPVPTSHELARASVSATATLELEPEEDGEWTGPF